MNVLKRYIITKSQHFCHVYDCDTYRRLEWVGNEQEAIAHVERMNNCAENAKFCSQCLYLLHERHSTHNNRFYC
jgi:hypothetical protein